jgi:hypothetical protein
VKSGVSSMKKQKSTVVSKSTMAEAKSSESNLKIPATSSIEVE